MQISRKPCFVGTIVSDWLYKNWLGITLKLRIKKINFVIKTFLQAIKKVLSQLILKKLWDCDKMGMQLQKKKKKDSSTHVVHDVGTTKSFYNVSFNKGQVQRVQTVFGVCYYIVALQQMKITTSLNTMSSSPNFFFVLQPVSLSAEIASENVP